MLRNAVGGGGGSAFQEKSVTKVYGSTLLVLRGVGGVKFPGTTYLALRNTFSRMAPK